MEEARPYFSWGRWKLLRFSASNCLECTLETKSIEIFKKNVYIIVKIKMLLFGVGKAPFGSASDGMIQVASVLDNNSLSKRFLEESKCVQQTNVSQYLQSACDKMAASISRTFCTCHLNMIRSFHQVKLF